MTPPLSSLLDLARRDGAGALLRRVAGAARERLVLDRDVLVLRVDLSDPKNRLRPRDATPGFRLLTFSRETLPRLLEVVERHEPWRVASVRRRAIEGARGFLAEHEGQIVGYVFYTEGTDHPARVVHSDLRWLGAAPARDEVYTFDYFLIEPARGLGAKFVRAVQEEQWRLGFRAAYGWVFADNRPALWLYRTTGWTEVARLSERRLFTRLAWVGGELFWLEAHSRIPLVGPGRVGSRLSHGAQAT